MKIPVRVGIIGGGQLARMLALAAHNMGLHPVVVASKRSDCALEVTSDFLIGINKENIRKLSDSVRVVGIESEFISVELLSEASNLLPGVKCLALTQSKLKQKEVLTKNKIPTQAFLPISNQATLMKAFETFG